MAVVSSARAAPVKVTRRRIGAARMAAPYYAGERLFQLAPQMRARPIRARLDRRHVQRSLRAISDSE